MKSKKILAVILSIALVVTQFSLLGVLTVGAETIKYTALTGREDFTFGVNLHSSTNYTAYSELYTAAVDAASLGAKAFRIGGNPTDEGEYALLESMADLANDFGMKMTLNLPHFLNHLAETVNNEDGSKTYNHYALEDINIDEITAYYSELATRYKGKVATYQLGNEMCNKFYLGGDCGRTYEGNYADVTAAAVLIQAVTDAIHEADPEAKVLVNFSWQHMGFIHGLKSIKLDSTTGLPVTADTLEENVITPTWDYIGIDWYSNGQNDDHLKEDGMPYDYDDIIDAISVYTEDIIVAETNLTPNGWADETQTDSSYIKDADWLAEFAQYAYANEKIKGFFVYELYDNPSYISEDEEGNRTYSKEAFYGLIDADGNKKETYNVIQALYGGTEIARPEITAAPASSLIGENLAYIYSGTAISKMPKTFHNMFEIRGQEVSVNISGADFIEFDFYVEDADMFLQAFKTARMNLRFYLYDETNTYRYAKNLDVEKISKDGWNHIAIATGDLTSNFANFDQGSTSVDYSKINGFTFTISNTLGNAVTNTAISGMNLAIANVCGTKIDRKTESTVGKVVAQFDGADAYTYRVGDNSGTTASNGYGLYTKSLHTYTPVDFTSAEYIEFDIYIEDYERFKENLSAIGSDGTAYNLSLSVFFSTTTKPINANKKHFDITSQITQSGWNHIVLNNTLTNSDFKTNSTAPKNMTKNIAEWKLQSFALNWTDADTATSQYVKAVTLDHGYDFIAMTDVIGTVKERPSNSAIGATVATLTDNSFTYDIHTRLDYIGATTRMTIGEATGIESELLTATDFTKADNIEFDIFTENWGSYGTALKENNLYLYFRMGSDNTAISGNFIQYLEIDNQIIQSGWNHIVIKKSDLTNRSIDWTAVSWFKIGTGGFDGADTKIAFSDSGLDMSMANVIGTIDLTAPTDVMQECINIGKSGINNVKFDSTGFADVSLESTIDISSARIIELDVYVEDNAISTLSFDLENEDGGYASYEFVGLVNGWNHLEIRISDLKVESFDESSINTVALYSTEGAEIYIANFYAADYVDGDANRDGAFDARDLVRTKKVACNATTKGNIIAMDLVGNDYLVKSEDLGQMRKLLLEN